MTKRYFAIPFITFMLAACGGGGGDKAQQLQSLKQQKSEIDKQIAALEKEVGGDSVRKVKSVVITTVADTLFEHYIDVQGSIDAREDVNVYPRAQGVITAIYVKEGQQVSKGQTLAQIDDQIAKANIAEVKTQLELNTTLFEKQRRLWEQKIGSEVQYLNAKTQMEGTQRKLATLQDQLSQSKIIAPISGTVDAVIAKVGDFAGASGGSAPFRVVNGSNLKVVASVAEAYAGKVKTGDVVLIDFPDINKELRTKIGFASKTIDPLSRTIRVEIPLQTDAALRPNMIAKLRIVDYTADKAITIPVAVIQYSQGKPYVILAQGSGKNMTAKRKDIEVGRTYNDKAQVVSGLQSGDRVVTTGFQGLNDNDAIQL